MRKSAHHGVFCEVIDALDIREARVNINVNGVLAPLELSLRTLKLAAVVRLRLIENDINAGCLCIGREEFVCSILLVVEALLQIGDRNTLALYNALSAPGLAVGLRFVRFCLRVCSRGGSVSARSVCEFSLLLGKICGRFALHSVGEVDAALAHVIRRLICRVKLRNVLTLGIGGDHSPRLRAVFLRCTFKSNVVRVLFDLCRGRFFSLYGAFFRGGVLGHRNAFRLIHGRLRVSHVGFGNLLDFGFRCRLNCRRFCNLRNRFLFFRRLCHRNRGILLRFDHIRCSRLLYPFIILLCIDQSRTDFLCPCT